MEKTVYYPVIFKQEENDVFVTIPDLEGGYTQGNDFEDAIKMAQDVIGNLLENINEKDYPKPSLPNQFDLDHDESLVYVPINMDEFRRKYPKTVRTNVTIPEDLKEKAKSENINISKVLTDALRAVVG